jgi:nucleoside-diphosphate-sugar epimerase
VIRYFIAQQDRNIVDSSKKLEIVTLHPTAVFGPTLISECTGSIEGIVKIMRRDVPGLPEMWLPCVDVRDVAEAHIEALVKPGLHGQRILLNKDSFQMITDLA